jgi:dethiobiotin synthetase
MPIVLFFAGTDTEVGKTYVASLVAQYLVQQGKRVGVYKPVASGCEELDGQRISEDAVALWQAAGQPRSLEDVCPQRFLAPLAPPEAAACEGASVDANRLILGIDVWRDHEIVLVEGAGGLFSPLADDMLNIDLATRLDAEVVLVAANRLGVIHQSLACCEAAAHRGLTMAGIILCDADGSPERSKSSNAEQTRRYCDVPIVATVGFRAGPDQVAGVARLVGV